MITNYELLCVLSAHMPTPPSSGVALWCTERLYASLRTPFASRQEFHIFRLPSHRARGGLNTSLMKGLTDTRSRLPPNETKPNCSALTATADARGSARPTVVFTYLPGS